MIYKITQINNTLPNHFMELDKTYFIADNRVMYLLHKPNNRPKIGDELDGEYGPDKSGALKFTKAKREQPQANPQTYKADPVKMKQEFTLEQARNMSIQRQVAVKGAIDITMWQLNEYTVDNLRAVYCDIMELLSEPDWRRFIEPDLPPIEGYDNLPNAEDIINLEADLERVLDKDEPF